MLTDEKLVTKLTIFDVYTHRLHDPLEIPKPINIILKRPCVTYAGEALMSLHQVVGMAMTSRRASATQQGLGTHFMCHTFSLAPSLVALS